MKKMLLICGALLAFSATAALAQVTAPGLYLGWGNCVGDGGTLVKTNLCTVTTGSNLMVASWVPSEEYPLFNSTEALIYLSFQGGVTPAWWGNTCTGRNVNSGLTANMVISGTALNCADAWGGNAGGGLAGYVYDASGYQWGGPGTAKIDLVAALAEGTEVDVTPGQEWFLFNVSFSNAKARVADACAGCLVQTCINLKEIDPSSFPTQPVKIIDNVNAGSQHYIYYQAAAGNTACPLASPAHTSSWGSIKALYR